MGDFIKLKVGDIVDSISVTHKFDKQKLYFLNTSDILDGKIVNKHYMPITELKGQAKKTIKQNDILFSEIRPKNKRFAFIDFADTEDFVVSTKLMVLRNKNPLVNTKYFYYKITSQDMLNYLQMRAESRIGSFPQITFDVLKNITFNIPSLDYQNKVVLILETLKEKYESNNKLISSLNEYAQLLFYKWFMEYNFPDKESRPYKDSGGDMKKISSSVIPFEWKFKKLDEVLDKIIDHRGKTPKKLGDDWSKEGVIALSAKNVKRGTLVNLDKANKVSNELYEKWMSDKLTEGDILMTSEAPLGEFYFILFDKEYCLSQRLFAIRAKKSEVLPTYLYFELSQPRGFKKIIARQSGSTVFGIRQEELRKVEVLIPPLSVQQEFDKLVFPMMEKIRTYEKENSNLIELRDLLIKKLIK